MKRFGMVSILLAGAMLLSGCAGNKNGAEVTTANNTASSANTATESATNNGHYENDGHIGENGTDKDVTGAITSEGGLANGNTHGNESSAGAQNGEANDNGAGANAGAGAANGGGAAPANTTVDKEGMAAAALRITKVCWGLGKEKDSDNRPVDAVNANQQYGELGGVFVDNTEEKVIYLTFDEGYENGYTTQILDTLKEKGVKAAFFVTYDYCKNSPDLVQRMIDEGHIVGNHSYTHPSFPDCSAREVEEEITMLHDYVKDNFNYEMTFFRFPKGEFSEKTLDIVKSLGYTSVFWSFAYADWDVNQQPAAAEAFDTITSATHKGAIYLLHAVSKANADCLGDVLDYWANNGYRMGNLEEIA